jgi:dihydrodipicolinate synthase/N-acetylneuraminate lyase
MARLTAQDIRGIYAMYPTPATPNASDPTATNTVDLEETRRSVDALVRAGVSGFMTNGTLGEGSTLTWDEHQAFAKAVIETVAGRAQVFIGATTLNTRDSIMKGKTWQAMGATGLFLGRPMWCENDDDTLVEFYRAVAAALPDMPIILYDNPEAFKGKIKPGAYARLAEIPQVIGAKYVGMSAAWNLDTAAVQGRIRILPREGEWYYAWRWSPEVALAAWSSAVACGPEPVIALQRAIEGGDADRARQITEDMRRAGRTLQPHGDFHIFSRYNIPLEKIRVDAAGWMKAGPARPPYHVVPEAYAEGARQAGREWIKLREQYRAAGSPAAEPAASATR